MCHCVVGQPRLLHHADRTRKSVVPGRALAPAPVLHPLAAAGTCAPDRASCRLPESHLAYYSSFHMASTMVLSLPAIAFCTHAERLPSWCDATKSAVAQTRSLVVVLKEPCNVVVPLPVAASLPAHALGRCALTTGGIEDVFQRAGVAPPEPGGSCSSDEEQALLATLEILLPRRITPLSDIAEVDGAAAMWAAVPGHVSDWLQLQADAKRRRG